MGLVHSQVRSILEIKTIEWNNIEFLNPLFGKNILLAFEEILGWLVQFKLRDRLGSWF